MNRTYKSATQETAIVVIAQGQNYATRCIVDRFVFSSSLSGIFGGCSYFVSGHSSFIGGGHGNTIDDTGAATSFIGVIGGGQSNCVCAGTNHSSIFSGCQNMVAGSCSSILGGSGNSDGGYDYVGIFGQNVNGVMNNAFHVEELVGQNIPDGATAYGSLPAGAFYFLCIGTGVGSKPLYMV